MDAKWMNTLAKNMNMDTMDLAIVACIVGMVFFMKFNRHEGKNEANLFIGKCLGIGFLSLIAFRIIKGLDPAGSLTGAILLTAAALAGFIVSFVLARKKGRKGKKGKG